MIPGWTLRIVASYAPHAPRLACLCAATRKRLRCGCTDEAIRRAHAALSAWGLCALAAAVCLGMADAVFHLARCLPYSEVLMTTMAAGPSVSEVDLSSDRVRATPLARAIARGAGDIVQMLLAARASPDGTQLSQRGDDPQLLVRFRCELFAQAQELDIMKPTFQMTPLVAAIQADSHAGGTELTRLLVQAGATINTFCWCCRHGDDMILSTPLIVALASPDLARLLLESKAEVNGIQYEEKDCLDDHPGDKLTPLQYAKASSQQHRLRYSHALVSAPVYSILREHHADAMLCGGVLVTEGDRVAISGDEAVVLEDCRSAGIGPDFDEQRLAALGLEAKVIQVDTSDNTVRVQVFSKGDQNGSESMGSRIWFPIRSVTILDQPCPALDDMH